jgi:hypothetical protein
MRVSQQGNTLGRESRKPGSGIPPVTAAVFVWLWLRYVLYAACFHCSIAAGCGCDMRWHLKLCAVEGAAAMQGWHCFWPAGGEQRVELGPPDDA